ncbi:NAD(FAD)-dependent dehydrogenase [Bacteroidia bacterium]|nr:NAD(FAD)-dependent dehydrogenase [Bacteroidia bacterium]
MAQQQLICISCPKGCGMTVTVEGDSVLVEGNDCKRGEAYAIAEMTNPLRVLTSSVWVEGGDYPLLSVKTAQAIPKAKLEEALQQLRPTRTQAPVRRGDVVIANIAGTGVDLIATRTVHRA